ncbi:MAG: hypothetical protein IJ705_02170 [Oscillospiraceae bacterium]|nr:hypothetical protein [Oscillospiraceae bacterium]
MKQRQGAFFFVLIALALAALAALALLLGPFSRRETAAVILAAPPAAEVGENPGAAGGGNSRSVTVDVDSVQNVVATMHRVEAYSRSLTAATLWDGGSVTTEINAWVRSGKARIELREAGGDTTKYVLLRDGQKWIWYSDRSEIWSGPAAVGDADRYQTLLSWEDVRTLDQRDIRDAGYTMYGGTLCIYVRYAEGELGYESLCYIAVDSGLLMGVETYDGDALVYSLSSSLPSLTPPDEALFELP